MDPAIDIGTACSLYSESESRLVFTLFYIPRDLHYCLRVGRYRSQQHPRHKNHNWNRWPAKPRSAPTHDAPAFRLEPLEDLELQEEFPDGRFALLIPPPLATNSCLRVNTRRATRLIRETA